MNNRAFLRLHNVRYDVYDTGFEGLVVSTTILHPHQETRGHEHTDYNEFYFVVAGDGELQLGKERRLLTVGDTLIIPKNLFHKVFNKTDKVLIIVCCWREV